MTPEQFENNVFTFVTDYLAGSVGVLRSIKLNTWKIREAIKLISNCKGTVWLIGNGGSAALASHMATDLQLAKVRAIALTDVVAITTYANDEDFGSCFEAQIASLFKPGDVLIAISGSGRSENIYRAAELASFLDGRVITLTGKDGGMLNMLPTAKVHIHVPTLDNPLGMAFAQDTHQAILHIIAYYLMKVRSNDTPDL